MEIVKVSRDLLEHYKPDSNLRLKETAFTHLSKLVTQPLLLIP